MRASINPNPTLPTPGKEAMSRRYHGQQIKDALFQPEQQPEKQFRVDRSLFLSLFKDLVPFGGGGSVGEMLAGRIWKLLAKDDQDSGLKLYVAESN